MSTAIVLTRGGGLVPVQTGMLRAPVERGTKPDLRVGTSAGAVSLP